MLRGCARRDVNGWRCIIVARTGPDDLEMNSNQPVSPAPLTMVTRGRLRSGSGVDDAMRDGSRSVDIERGLHPLWCTTVLLINILKRVTECPRECKAEMEGGRLPGRREGGTVSMTAQMRLCYAALDALVGRR